MSAADMMQTIKALALNVRLSFQLLYVSESSYYERINQLPSKTQLKNNTWQLRLFNFSRRIGGGSIGT